MRTFTDAHHDIAGDILEIEGMGKDKIRSGIGQNAG
jgi:hypothetical protein